MQAAHRATPALPRGLYVITDPVLTPAEMLVARVRQAILGGARMVQLRDKSADRNARRRQARALLRLCNAHDVPLIINDDVELARETGAHGVHLGKDDSGIEEARASLGAKAIIGVSCYNDLERAGKACRSGADYVAFGSFFPSMTKLSAPTADLSLIRQARALSVPVCAIGGITATNAAPLIRAGAQLLAVIHSVFAQADPEAAAREFTALFEREPVY